MARSLFVIDASDRVSKSRFACPSLYHIRAGCSRESGFIFSSLPRFFGAFRSVCPAGPDSGGLTALYHALASRVKAESAGRGEKPDVDKPRES